MTSYVAPARAGRAPVRVRSTKVDRPGPAASAGYGSFHLRLHVCQLSLALAPVPAFTCACTGASFHLRLPDRDRVLVLEPELEGDTVRLRDDEPLLVGLAGGL